MKCIFDDVPFWYWFATFIICFYQTYRGFRYYWKHMGMRNDVAEWSRFDKVSLICVQAAYLYMVCTLAGFFALLASYKLWIAQQPMNSIDTGSAVLITFSFLIGILGVSGELGQLVQRGKLQK